MGRLVSTTIAFLCRRPTLTSAQRCTKNVDVEPGCKCRVLSLNYYHWWFRSLRQNEPTQETCHIWWSGYCGYCLHCSEVRVKETNANMSILSSIVQLLLHQGPQLPVRHLPHSLLTAGVETLLGNGTNYTEFIWKILSFLQVLPDNVKWKVHPASLPSDKGWDTVCLLMTAHIHTRYIDSHGESIISIINIIISFNPCNLLRLLKQPRFHPMAHGHGHGHPWPSTWQVLSKGSPKTSLTKPDRFGAGRLSSGNAALVTSLASPSQLGRFWKNRGVCLAYHVT